MTDWEAIVEKRMAGLETTYAEQEKKINDAYGSQVKGLDAQRNVGEQKLQDARGKSLQQAYITKKQSERDLPALLASQGINGGAAETSLVGLNRNYYNTRNSANNQYSADLKDIESEYTKLKYNAESDLNTKLAELRAQRRTEDLALAQFAYQAQQAEEEKKRQEEERQRQEAEAAAASARSSSGGSRKSSGSTTTSKSHADTSRTDTDPSRWVPGYNPVGVETIHSPAKAGTRRQSHYF